MKVYRDVPDSPHQRTDLQRVLWFHCDCVTGKQQPRLHRRVSLAPGGSTLVVTARLVAVWTLGGVGCRDGFVAHVLVINE